LQFLGIGYQEILLVLGLMLVVLGPERMPTVAYQIGRAVRTLQSYARAVRSEFSEEISYIEDQYKTVRGEVQSTREVLRDEQARFAAEMREATAPIQQSLAEVPQLAGAATPLNVINLPDRSGIDAAPAQSPSESAATSWPSADPDPGPAAPSPVAASPITTENPPPPLLF